ncbi:MarR family transcriptional regulator [Antarctobacter sp.]|uniref:MarR family winged helix-turn-helix transcriptional regulator n=1 Tax=Antarctobacter sp. TaxID=1872577 RepID=UPI002B26CA1F|nr:MarR family transcriptional regulator [Antarctobacter sp.]
MTNTPDAEVQSYVLEEQIGFLLRKAYQRNSNIFLTLVPGNLTTMQFSIMRQIAVGGPISQNKLGRSVAMDGATTKGVVDRLIARDLLTARRDPEDRRRHLLSLTPQGEALITEAVEAAARVTAETLSPLTGSEQDTLLRLLSRIT